MPPKSMNVVIHDAIRRDLRRFVDALSSYDETDKARARGLWRAWENFDDQLTHHHEGEHDVVWSAVEQLGVSPSLILRLDAEHDAMAKALDRTRAAMSVFTGSARTKDAAKALAAVRKLQKVTNDHLAHEEAELEPVFAEHTGAPELKSMAQELRRQPLPRIGRFFAWLGDSDDPDERAAVTQDVPAPVVAIIGGIFGLGYRRSVAPVWRS